MFIEEFGLVAGTQLDQYAERVKNTVEQEKWPSASFFELISFEKKLVDGQDFYLMEYRVREQPDSCTNWVLELIAVGSNLPGPSQGYRVRHKGCEREMRGKLDLERRTVLESFRVITRDDGYYNQFINVNGLTIKASGKVKPSAMQEVASMMRVMLDGRQDIQDCMLVSDSALAIVPDGDPVTALPEFAYLSGGADMWGQLYDSTDSPGLGGDPVSSTPEQKLRTKPGYPPNRDVHEPAHHIDGQCFTQDDLTKWKDIHRRAVDRVHSVFGYDVPPFDWGLLVDYGEFFAGLTQYYFFQADAPKRYAEEFFPEAFEFLEDVYGRFEPTESDRPGWVRYVSPSGYPIPWLVPGGVPFEHSTLGFTIDLLSGWEVSSESIRETLIADRNWPFPEIRIKYIPLPTDANAEGALERLAEAQRSDWQQWTRYWNQSEVRSFERESLDAQESYWIRYHGHDSPERCKLDRIERLLIASHEGREYGVILEGSACGRGNDFAVRDFETMLRNFNLPTPSPGPTPTPQPTATPIAFEARTPDQEALVALYKSTDGANWNNNTNWLTDLPLNRWHGVSTVGDRVTALHLGDNGLWGEIPPELGNLTELRELWFGDDNDLTGELPDELSRLTKLEVLDLGYSDMFGVIPAWLGDLRRLRHLYLDNNRFEGEVTDELGNLSDLEVLTIQGNRRLSGPLPETLTNIKNLRWLPFNDTGLCAPLTASFQAWLKGISDWRGSACQP